MTKLNKILLGALGLGMVSMASSASATDNAVLFKIHDVVPIKNADGLVTACDVGATFYNRTANEIKNASLNLQWIDEVVGETIGFEERAAREAQRANRRNTPRFSTSTYTTKEVNLKLRLPSLKSQQQVTLKTKVSTDRCFLLMNDMEIQIENCGSSSEGGSTYSSPEACEGLFTYVSPKSPEYYNEFKALTQEEQDAEKVAIMKTKSEALETAYKSVIGQVDILNTILNKASQ